ncbi:arsenic resistance protein [Microbacterium sp.]|uniref:arsenic resistance protein n=1 Tax=Microbacterium sp. TaxID=51671 RepID=UPI0039E62C58
MERWQILLYLGALAVGAAVGLAFPSAAHGFELAINPVLIVLLYATFLAVPFPEIGKALKDARFLGAVLVLNFVLVPVVVWVLSRFVAGEQALLVGVFLVLLTPCIDYVIVFSRLAGGASSRLLAAAPLLMLLQLALLPVYLLVFVGPELVEIIDVAPFIDAFLVLIVLPLTLAILTQLLARRFALARAVERAMETAMVPVMMLTLAVVVASQIEAVRSEFGLLVAVIPLYVAFLIVMPFIGWGTARLFRQDVPSARALIFSGATRNSLVVLPLALALPESLALAAVVVVTQTLVELVGMVVYVRAIPLLVRGRGATVTA